MLASRAPPVESRGAVLAAPLPPPPQQPQPPQPTTQLPLHVPLHMPQLGAPFMATQHQLLQYESFVRPVAAHRYDPGAAAVDAADAVAAAATDRLFRESYFRRMRSDYEATAMFSPPEMLWMAPALPPPPGPPLHQTAMSNAANHATHGVLRHPQAKTSPPSSAPPTRTPPGAARDSPAPVNLSAPHKAAQPGYSYPMFGTTSPYAPSYAHPSMVGRTAAATTATYSPPAASPAPVPAVTPLGPPSAPPKRRAPMSSASASMANLPPPPAPPPPAAPAPSPSPAPPPPPPPPPPVVASTSSAASSSTPAPHPADNTQTVTATPSPVTRDLACFKRGALIRLASGAVRCVENMRAEDLVTSADPALQSYAAKVVKLTPRGGGAVAVSMSLRRSGDNSAQFESELEVPEEHPFFVFSQGWSSYKPEKSLQILGLTCQRLQVGHECISLARRTQSTPVTNGSHTPFNSAVPAPPSSRSSNSRNAKKSAQTAPSVQIPQSSGNSSAAASDASSANNSSRKRRWSAPDQFEEENKALKVSN